jgi:maltooligosyltrehalose trehalohydrolase
MTGHNEAYYSDYRGAPQELISVVKHGFLYQGQRYSWQAKRRGSPSIGLAPARFVNYIENHDQIANSGRGARPRNLTSLGRYKAVTALLLLGPGTPMLFQGQEFASSSPFYFFADHNPELRELVKEGRIQFLSQFPSLARPETRACLVDPGDESVFRRCKLNFEERRLHADLYGMHKDLLRLRREDPVFSAQRPRGVDGAVLGEEAFVLRFFGEGGDDRLLLVNLGRDLHFDPAPEPLLAPPENRLWETIWSSEDPAYGGCGSPYPDGPDNWRLPAHAALAMRPKAIEPWEI